MGGVTEKFKNCAREAVNAVPFIVITPPASATAIEPPDAKWIVSTLPPVTCGDAGEIGSDESAHAILCKTNAASLSAVTRCESRSAPVMSGYAAVITPVRIIPNSAI